jgi:Caspase domain
MKYKLLALVLVGVLVGYVLPLLPLNQVAAQNDPRGMRVQTAPQGEQRIALVMGNSAYKDSPLVNPVNDARAMAEALRNLGFEVLYGENLLQNDMKRNIRAFGQKIRNGGIGLFYYAGHGIQVKGKNYLIPVGATITSEEEIEYESVDVGLVLAQMESARNRLNLIILDACRNNPFAKSFRSAEKGLASIDAPSGTLIAYATAPGSVASDGTESNGVYTQQLLKYMRVSDLSIEQIFKQVRVAVRTLTKGQQIPWESSSLEGEFHFSPSTPVSSKVNETTTAKTEYKTQKGQFSVWVDTNKWQPSPQTMGSAEYMFLHKRGDGFALVIPERLSFRFSSIKEIVFNLVRQAAPDAKVISEEIKMVDGQNIVAMKIEGTVQGLPLIYYGYYYTGEAGTIQVVTYTGKNLFNEYEQDFTELLNGLKIHILNR